MEKFEHDKVFKEAEILVEMEKSGNPTQKYERGSIKRHNKEMEENGGKSYIQDVIDTTEERLSGSKSELKKQVEEGLNFSERRLKELSEKLQKEKWLTKEERDILQEQILIQRADKGSEGYKPGTLKDSNESYIKKVEEEAQKRVENQKQENALKDELLSKFDDSPN